MNKSAICAVLTAVMILMAGNVLAASFGLADSITIPDKVFTSETWYGNYEDNEVEPGCVKAQIWDLEGFYFKNNILSVVGGFDFAKGTKDPNTGKLITTGDVFIDKDVTGPDAAQYGPTNDNTGSGQGGKTIVTNRFGYDYALNLNFATNTYNVYALADGIKTTTVYYSINQEANPVSYVSGGTLKGSGAFTFGTLSNEKATELGLLGYGGNNTHYYLTGLDLSFLGANVEFISHLTLSCGNDDLMGRGKTAPVPEPATLILLGSGIVGLYWRKRSAS